MAFQTGEIIKTFFFNLLTESTHILELIEIIYLSAKCVNGDSQTHKV